MQKPIMELSHSSAMQVDSCLRKYQIRKRFAWPADTEREDSLAAMSGRAIHVYLQTLWSDGSEDDAHFAFFMEWDFNIELTARSTDKATRGLEAALMTCYYLTGQLQPSYERLAKLDLSHLPTHNPADDPLTPAVEVKFNIILTHAKWKHDYHYRGLIDLIEYDPTWKLFTVTDIKTHRAPRPETEHRYRYSSQCVPYGMIVEALTAIQDEPLQFQVRYISAYVDLVAPRVEVFTFQKDANDIREWLYNCALRIERMERVADNPVWPRSESGCDSYGRPCIFYANHCSIEQPQALQDYIIGFNPITPSKPFGEWFTITIDMEAQGL